MTEIKHLTVNQYEQAVTRARAAVLKRAGDEPERSSYAMSYEPLVTWLDGLIAVVFGAAFVISAIHMFAFAAGQAAITHTETAGISPTLAASTVAMQLASVLLAEFAMLAFFTYGGVELKRGHRGYGITYYALGALAAAFVFYVNLASGAMLLMAVIPPVVTVGIGFRLEAILMEYIRRQDEINTRYQAAMADWNAARDDVTQHSEYMPMLQRIVWESLLRKSPDLVELTPPERRQAAVTEIEYHSAFGDLANPTQAAAYQSGTTNATAPIALVGPASTKQTPSASARIASVGR
jgi:hypothetical protein